MGGAIAVDIGALYLDSCTFTGNEAVGQDEARVAPFVLTPQWRVWL
jgi:hypothetical protein